MLKARQLTLTALISAALISTAQANEQSQAEGFVEGAEGSVLFRTGFLSRDKKHGVEDTRSAAQTAIVKLDSGFTQGTVGVGVGIVGDWSFKLGRNDHTGNDMIPRDANGNPHNQWTRGGANVKARVSNTTATYGTQVLDIPVLASNTARLVPEYFTGLLVESKEIENLDLLLGKFTKNELSNQISTDGAALDRAIVWGGKYKALDNLSVAYYGTDIKDRLDRHYVNTNFTQKLADDSSLTYDFSGYHTKWDKQATPYLYSYIGSIDDSYDNTIFALSGTYNKGPHNVMLAYQQNTGSAGYDYGAGTGFGDGKQSIYMPNSYLSDFIGNKEKSAQLQYTFDFGALDVPGLSWTTAFVYGWNIHTNEAITNGNTLLGYKAGDDNANEREFFNQIKYTVQSGVMKDASLRVRNSYYRASDSYQNGYIGDTNEWRIWLDIPVKLF